ncbi:MAG: hypothetical protein PWQ18_1415 [Clostridia bacterium]|nr:hypothetical protein [Clostridia bacterium]
MFSLKQKALIFMPLVLSITTYICYKQLVILFGPKIGYLSGFLFYWICWGLLFSLWILGRQGFQELFRDTPLRFGQPAWLGLILLVILLFLKEIEEAKAKYRDEVRQKYDPKLVAESEEKTSRYTEADWRAIHDQEMGIYRRLAAAMDAGKSPADPEVQEVIGERYREINERYYTCTPQIFQGLGEMYVADSRFTEFYERMRPGMAAFMRQATAIYSDNLEKGE